MKKAIDTVAQTVTFTFDGDLPSVTLAMADVSPENATYAMLHGFAARIGDNAAISRKQKDGSIITVTETMRRDEVAALRDHYASGSKDWNIAGGTRKAPQNATILAIAAKLGITYVEAEAEVQRRMLAELGGE